MGVQEMIRDEDFADVCYKIYTGIDKLTPVKAADIITRVFLQPETSYYGWYPPRGSGKTKPMILHLVTVASLAKAGEVLRMHDCCCKEK